jgi:hypothetical protein
MTLSGLGCRNGEFLRNYFWRFVAANNATMRATPITTPVGSPWSKNMATII